MAIKVQRKINETNDRNQLETAGTIVLKYLTRFDMIDVYTKAIISKIEDAAADYNDGAPAEALVLHFNIIKQLANDIKNQVKDATETDLQRGRNGK